ncbi:MAG: hypothetical protein ACOC06_05870, partial [Halorubrum sp.]
PALDGEETTRKAGDVDDDASETAAGGASETTDDDASETTDDDASETTDDDADDAPDVPDDPVVSVTVRGDEVTQQPIPRSLSDGDLFVSARDDDWTYIENVDAGDRELYYRPDDPTQQENLAVDPDEEAQAVIDRFAPVVDAHAELLRERGAAAEAAAAERGEEEVDEDLEARLEALGYK